MTRTVLITGVTGQDGLLLARSLLADGVRVVGMVRPGPASPRLVYLDGVEIRPVDLHDVDGITTTVADVAADEVYHLGGITSVGQAWSVPDEVAAVNERAVQAVVDAVATRTPAARVFLASSAEVFGPELTTPAAEDTPWDPRGPYAESKARVLEIGRTAREAGLHVGVGILFPHESVVRGERFVTRKITRAVAEMALGRRDRLDLGNLDVVRDWGAATDVVRAMRAMVAADEPRELVVATGEGRSLRDLVDLAFAAGGVADPWSRIDVDPALARPTDAAMLVGDPSRCRTQLHWTPRTTIEETVTAMVAADLRRVGEGRDEIGDLLTA